MEGNRVLSPEEIESRQFQIGLRGYDVEEVTSFLARVAEAYRSVLGELQRQLEAEPPAPGNAAVPESRAPEVSQPSPSFDTVGREVATVLASAREAAEQMKDRAHARVAEMLEAAERKAFELQMDAQAQATQRMRELMVSSERIRAAEARLREGLGQIEAVLAMTRLDLDQAPGAPAPSRSEHSSPWRPVPTTGAHEAENAPQAHF